MTPQLWPALDILTPPGYAVAVAVLLDVAALGLLAGIIAGWARSVLS